MTTNHLKDLPAEYRDALHSDAYTQPQFLINPEHPEADEYLFGITQLKRGIVFTTAKMKPRDVTIIKSWHQGDSTEEIAQRANCHPNTVKKVVNSQLGQELYLGLQQLSAAIDGPNDAERRAMLWRIARIAETRAPKTAIASVAELNRMSPDQHTLDTSGQPTIVIMNQTVIPRGPLDL